MFGSGSLPQPSVPSRNLLCVYVGGKGRGRGRVHVEFCGDTQNISPDLYFLDEVVDLPIVMIVSE